jgi:integrase
MRRKRYQTGSVSPRKHGKNKVWVAQWWEDGRKRSKVLGRCAEMGKSEAEALMAVILKPMNEDAGQTLKPVFTFGVYLEQVFLPLCRRKWKESTRMTTEPRMKLHLKPSFGAQLLRDITRDQMQTFLDQKAEKLSRSIVHHLRWDLNSIFKTAMSDGLIGTNPASALFTPACKPEGEKRVMSPQEIRLALSVLDARERLIFRMAVFDGMRPGEILAIRLGNISGQSILIDQRVYYGNIDTPKGRKGKRTSRTVGLSPGTVAELELWRTLLLKQERNSYLFPTENETPLRLDNLRKRHMLPKLEKVGLEWATFQVLRRTNASLSREANIDDKVAADQRGHGLGVSLETYSISSVKQKIDAAKRLETEVIQ